MPQITPNNLAFAAGGVFTTGGSVTFGYENVPGDPEAPATLKGIFVDEAQTVAALNPQPLDSDAKYQQSATGILYGPGVYSVLVRNSLGVQVAYNPSYSGAIGEAAAYNVGTGAGEIPLNSDLNLGTSATKDIGIANNNIQVVAPGSIINRVVYRNTSTTTEESINSTTPFLTSIQHSYTPKRSDSIITIECSGSFRAESATVGTVSAVIQLRDSTSLLDEYYGFLFDENSSIIHNNPYMVYRDAQMSSSVRNYRIYILKQPGVGVVDVAYVPWRGQATMIITEFME